MTDAMMEWQKKHAEKRSDYKTISDRNDDIFLLWIGYEI